MMFKIWMILVILSSFAFFVGYLNVVSSFVVALLLTTTFIKGHLVIEYFMGLKNVSLKYRIIPSIWLFVVIMAVAIAYYIPIN